MRYTRDYELIRRIKATIDVNYLILRKHSNQSYVTIHCYQKVTFRTHLIYLASQTNIISLAIYVLPCELLLLENGVKQIYRAAPQ